MMFEDLLPIIIILGIGFVAIACAIVLQIRSKKSLLAEKENDFIDDLIERKRRQLNANLGNLSWSTYVGLLVVVPIVLAGLGLLFLENKAFCVVLGFFGIFVPELIVRIKAKQQKSKFEEKYAMALRALASGLRSGLSIEQAVENVGRNAFLDESIKNGFKQISSDIKLGISIDEAFKTFAIESGSKDAMDVASVIAMQSRVGGSEATVITTILQNINNRIMTRKEIKSLFADTDMLVLVMDFLPFLLAAILYFAAPEMIAPFFESPAMTLVFVGILAFAAVGSIVIHKISRSAKEA